jgi:hypothetical protein
VEKEAGRELHRAWGFLALGFYVVHATALILIGDTPHLLWSCHLASIVLAAGLLLRQPALAGVALMWLTVGLPTWIAAILSNPGFFQPTSILTHFLGLVLAGFAVRGRGMPLGTWWRATLLLIALWWLTWAVTPGSENVNITDRYWFGWEEGLFGSFPAYVAALWSVSAGLFFAVQVGARALGWRAE